MADTTNPFADTDPSTANEDDPFGSPQNYGQSNQGTQPPATGGPPAPPPQALTQSTQPSQVQNDPPPSYDQSNDYATGNNNNNNNIVNQVQNEVAYQAGVAVANNAASAGQQYANEAKQDYKVNTQQQKDVNALPETPMFIIKIIQWFPLRFFAMIGGILLVVFPIVDIITNRPTFTTFFIFAYIIIFGFIIFCIESPTFTLSRKVQTGVSFWFRLLSRTWGRAWFYLFISFLCFGNVASRSKSKKNTDTTEENKKTFFITIIAGVYLIIISLLSFIFGRLAAKKYQRMYIFMAAGTEGDQLIGNLIRKFDELDQDQDGRLGSEDITKLAEQSGRTLSNAERHAIQSFLDESCNGYVSKEDWMKQWTTYNLEQKFL